MLQKYNMWRVLKVFFNDPMPSGGGLQLREISRKAGIAPLSVKLYLKELCKGGKEGYPLVVKLKHRLYGYPVYWANRESKFFLFYKKIDTLLALEESGFLDYLEDYCLPASIVLFGSAARGEDLKESDIDIFLQCKEKKLDLEEFESKIGRTIHLFFEEKFKKLSPELRNNMINGIVLRGYLKVF